MKIQLSLAFAIIFITGLTLAQTRNSADEAGIRKTIAQYERAWNIHDGRMLGECFTEDADFINIFGAHLKGRSAIEKILTRAHTGWARGSEMHFTIDTISFVSSDAAVVLVTFPLTLSGGPDPSHGFKDFEYNFTNGPHIGVRIMRKVQGQWLIQLFENTKVLDAKTIALLANKE